MNNAEWVIENEPWLFGDFGCAECVKSYDGKHCTLPEDEIDDTECAEGHVAWLLLPHESSLEPPQTGDCDKDEREPVESENAPVTDADSRERLEADVQAWCFLRYHDERIVLGWLDRQAKITEREVKLRELYRFEENHREHIDSIEEVNRQLNERIAELQNRKCPGYEPENHRCKWHDADFELNADRLNDLKRENARLEKQVDELEEHHRWIAEETVSARELELKEERDYWRGQFRACLGAAAKDGYALGLLRYPRPDNLIEPFLVVTNCLDELRDQLADERRTHAENAAETHDFAEDQQKTPEPQHICDTCRWFESEKWVKNGKNSESFQHAKCHHGTGSFPTDADDWCGEWSE